MEKALLNLRRARRLSVSAMRATPIDELETLVRPSGYFRQKARNLKTFIAFLDERYSGSLSRMFAEPTAKLRAELLELNGVGPETADSILLYAGNHPVFVVDAYTRRVLLRHGIINQKTSYEEIRAMIEHAISSSEAESLVVKESGSDPRHPVSRMSSSARTELAQHYNELHALIVRVGNHYCRAKQICEGCPLQTFLKTPKSATAHGAPESYLAGKQNALTNLAMGVLHAFAYRYRSVRALDSGFAAFHVAGGLIHLLLIFAVISIIWHLVAGRRATV